MAFRWKEHNSIWKGEGIYFLTFVVAGRRKLLGTLVPAQDSRWYRGNVQRSQDTPGQAATSSLPVYSTGNVQRSLNNHGEAASTTSALAVAELTPFGMAVSRQLQELPTRIPGLKICAKQLMPDHIHVVIWATHDTGRTIRQIGNGLRIGIKKIAIQQGLWQATDGHILDIPYIRTLAHRGQLRSMIDYVHSNPDNAWMRQQHPELYIIRRDIRLAHLSFDGMGKERLLAYPDRQVVALSRSLTPEQIEAAVSRALRQAERGAVTYTAAINDGEKAVAKAIRQAGLPLVVMLQEGFPAQGTEAARFFHPGGVYHQACGEGRLMLLAPKAENYQHPTLVALTDRELEQKAEAKGLHYTPIPHHTTRWRMIAGNVMLRMIAAPQQADDPPLHGLPR